MARGSAAQGFFLKIFTPILPRRVAGAEGPRFETLPPCRRPQKFNPSAKNEMIAANFLLVWGTE
ncbi:MAG: hypothetical protein CM15mP95_2410 [Alphaproteobacteria bacterium]|nr:MAG: hypothetical protein CM15mP95_2410 [Alphaproteobacteria bacterium]